MIPFKEKVKTNLVGSTITALLTAAIAVAALLFWSATHTDKFAVSRQQEFVAGFADRVAFDLAARAEQSSRWDEAVRKTRQPAGRMEWLDGLYGPDMFTSWGRNEAYVVDSNDRAYYAERDGPRVDPRYFEERAALVRPMLAELRRKMLDPSANIDSEQWKVPGVADIQNVDGTPAIVILKPIVSDTGKIIQEPGTEHIVVFVYWLVDYNLQKLWGRQYHLDGIRFSWTDTHSDREAVRPMISPRTGRTAGYFIWQPYRPGSIVLSDMILPLLAALALVGFVVFRLIRRVRRSTAELMASEAHARHLAFHDVLTGLPNRALFDDRLERALAGARRHSEENVALLYLDLDRFKKVNDTLGHPAGDELIREVARRLFDVVRESDTVARLGGDEFAIIQKQGDSEDEIRTLCERIIKAIAAPFDVIGSQVFVGVSIGIARSNVDGFDRTELSRKADIALYDAKIRGRGRFTIFAEDMDSTIQIRRTIEGDLRSALDAGDQLRVSYQPKYDADSQAIAGVEALVRWEHPTKGLLSPTLFVPIAEETGLIEPLGEWVLEQACAAAVLWPSQNLSVNVSAVQLRNPFFAHRAIAILERTKLDPSRLELEITETSFLESLESCIPNLKMLRAVGVRIALDDFGTGYSSFTYLRNFEVDRIKIDRSFTTGIDSSDDSNAIIKAIVDLAHSTGIKITAEGVETIRQSRFLSDVGCDELQGFLMSRPLSLRDIDTLLGVERAGRTEATLAA